MPKIVRVPTTYRGHLERLRSENDIDELAPLVAAIAPFQLGTYEFPGYLEFDDGEPLLDLNGLEPVAVAGSVMGGLLMGALINPVFFITIPVIAHLLVSGKTDARKIKQTLEDFSDTEIEASIEISATVIDANIQSPIAVVPSLESTQAAAAFPYYVPSRPIAPSFSSFNGTETIEPRDIATDLGNNPQSALIFGTPGAGKGMTISNAIRTLRLKLPNVTVMMMDPKGDQKERGYWESQVDIFESRSLLKSSPRSSAEWMMRCVEKFQNIDGPKLLIWDELLASLTVLKGQNVPKGEEAFPCLTDFQQFMNLNLSLGPSSGIWIWGMSQSANLSDLGLTSGGLSTTRIIALISPDNVGAVEAYLATKAIAAPKGGMAHLDKLMEQSPVKRACYDGKTKKWYPVARLENHSGFDRDNADWNNLGAPTATITATAQSSRQPIEAPNDGPTEADIRDGITTLLTLAIGAPKETKIALNGRAQAALSFMEEPSLPYQERLKNAHRCLTGANA